MLSRKHRLACFLSITRCIIPFFHDGAPLWLANSFLGFAAAVSLVLAYRPGKHFFQMIREVRRTATVIQNGNEN